MSINHKAVWFGRDRLRSLQIALDQ